MDFVNSFYIIINNLKMYYHIIVTKKIREIYISDYGSPIERATKLKRG